MEIEIIKSCQSCQSSRIEYLTPIDYDCDAHSLHGIDYQYRCVIHDMVVPPDFFCDKFEFPF